MIGKIMLVVNETQNRANKESNIETKKGHLKGIQPERYDFQTYVRSLSSPPTGK